MMKLLSVLNGSGDHLARGRQAVVGCSSLEAGVAPSTVSAYRE